MCLPVLLGLQLIRLVIVLVLVGVLSLLLDAVHDFYDPVLALFEGRLPVPFDGSEGLEADLGTLLAGRARQVLRWILTIVFAVGQEFQYRLRLLFLSQGHLHVYVVLHLLLQVLQFLVFSRLQAISEGRQGKGFRVVA